MDSSAEISSFPRFGVCGTATTCWDGSDTTVECWNLVWTLLAVGVVLILYGDTCAVRENALIEIYQYMKGYVKSGSNDGNNEGEEEKKKKPLFITNHRSEANFIKGNHDPTMIFPPADMPDEYSYWRPGADVFILTTISIFKTLKQLTFARYIHSIIFSALGWGCVCSAFSTVLWLMISYDEFCVAQGFRDDTPNKDYIQQVGDVFANVRRDYLFFPVFLLVGFVGNIINQWRRNLILCYRNQRSIGNLSLICGGAVKSPVTPDTRKKLYKVYRYLNLMHAIIYKKVSPTIKPFQYDKEFIHDLHLLTKGEAQSFANVTTKQRMCVIGWLSASISDLMATEGFNKDFCGGELAVHLAAFRGTSSRVVVDSPDIYTRMMVIMVQFLVWLYMAGVPFSYVIYAGSSSKILLLPKSPCFQPLVMVSVFFFTSSFKVAGMMIHLLRNPYVWPKEIIKVDHMLSDSERTSFVLLRAKFDDEDIQRIDSEALEKPSTSLEDGESCEAEG